jgi:ABC-type dipeptide/oligopeptide/nickel transport system ATPase subunit
MIDARGFSARFGATLAVDGISFAVEPGAALGIVGESGSGKSTVLRAVAGLLEDWSGELVVDGAAMKPGRPRRLGGGVQMVFQDPYGSLHPRHTVDRALAEPLAIHRRGDADRRIAAALTAVGLEPAHRFRYPHQLSGGQRQRVAIARALILDPAIVLLDEPTSALDATVQAEILVLLNRLRRDRQLTYVLVSHNLAVVAALCARIAVMREGRIVEELAVADLHAGAARQPYTRELIEASRGFRRPRSG